MLPNGMGEHCNWKWEPLCQYWSSFAILNYTGSWQKCSQMAQKSIWSGNEFIFASFGAFLLFPRPSGKMQICSKITWVGIATGFESFFCQYWSIFATQNYTGSRQKCSQVAQKSLWSGNEYASLPALEHFCFFLIHLGKCKNAPKWHGKALQLELRASLQSLEHFCHPKLYWE